MATYTLTGSSRTDAKHLTTHRAGLHGFLGELKTPDWDMRMSLANVHSGDRSTLSFNCFILHENEDKIEERDIRLVLSYAAFLITFSLAPTSPSPDRSQALFLS
jgi:hypothetical protein